eukprot:Gb_25315 [translate_table: standard]
MHDIILQLVYAWELPRVAGNAWNGLIPTVALQLAAVAYGVNLFSEPLKDLEDCMVRLQECLRNPGYRLDIVMVCNWFVVDGALPLKFYGDLNDDIWFLWVHGPAANTRVIDGVVGCSHRGLQ